MFAADLIARFVSAVILLLFGFCIYLGIKITILKFEIRDLHTSNVELQQAVDECKYSTDKLGESNTYLRQRLQQLDSYYRRKSKPPVVTGETFNKDNLFMVNPR